MAYRERIAWMMLASIVTTLGPYLIYVYGFQQGVEIPMPGFEQLKLYGIASSAFAVFVGLGYLVLRLRYPIEAKVPADERDAVIERQSYRAGYFVLLTGIIIVGIYKPFVESGWSIVNDSICIVFITEVVRDTIIVRNYYKQRS
ncbi:MAG: hypothetical protein IPH85_14040 [Ignavibacteria bacterium]|nr:hypothetical protein [Ignavibacteria bacterium]MBK6759101.1 hypothetical protein [Ignavibacteria bacterium]MBK7034509.1 hypothetical protein [Ignavibacteria bacterium]MBK7187011.1 hypothetical protein [Ignavibacteria bacterium]MBK7412784.1 hypothetical protein [Ignavibacteria bacterium]